MAGNWDLEDVATAPPQAAPPQGSTTPVPSFPSLIAPHPAPDGSGELTNLSDVDYAAFKAGSPGTVMAPRRGSETAADKAVPTGQNWDLETVATAPEPPAAPAEPPSPQSKGIVANVGAGTSAATAEMLGAPVDAMTWGINKVLQGATAGARAINPMLGMPAPAEAPQITAPVGGSDWWKGVQGYIGADPRTVPAVTPMDRIAQATGQGIAGMVLPAAGARALPQIISTMGAPALSKTAPTIEAVRQSLAAGGSSLTSQAKLGAGMGAGGQAITEATPEPLKPYVAPIAPLLAGGLTAAAPIAAKGAVTLAKPFSPIVAPLTPVVRTFRNLAPIATTGARERSVGRVLNQDVAGAPVQSSPVGPLNLAQATNVPVIAARTDVAGELNAAANAKLRQAQQDAIVGQIGKIGAPASLADASSATVEALRKAADLGRAEERRLWTVPELAKEKVTPGPIKDAVRTALATIDPVLRSSMSPELKAAVNRLMGAGKTTVRDLNGIRSDIAAIARNPMADGGQRVMAHTLSEAFLDGMGRVPEIAGAPEVPATPSAAPGAPTQPPPTPRAPTPAPEAIPLTTRQRRPETLVDWLIAKGGLRDDGGELAKMGAGDIHHRAGGRLVNPKGMTLDDAQRLAEGAGFLGPDADVNKLLDRLNDQIGPNGQPQFRLSEQAEGDAYDRAADNQRRNETLRYEATDRVNVAAEGMGAKLTKDERETAAQMVMEGEHPEEAIRQAVFPTEERELERNAQRAVFEKPGMEGRTQGVLEPPPGPTPAIPPNPAIARAYQDARDFTRRLHGVIDQPNIANALNKGEGGFYTAPASTAAERFFNFSKGAAEGPQSIEELAGFVDKLKAQPQAGAAAQELRESARSYINAALVRASRTEEGRNFNPQLMIDFLTRNQAWMERSGILEKPQIDAARELLDYARMLRRPDQLRQMVNSATYRRFKAGDTFITKVMGPWTQRILQVGLTVAGAEHSAGLGALIGAGLGETLHHVIGQAETAMTELMGEALHDPQLAQDLMMKASGGKMLPQTRQQKLDDVTRRLTAGATVSLTHQSPDGGNDNTQTAATMQNQGARQ